VDRVDSVGGLEGFAAPYRYALVSGRVRDWGFQQTSFPQAEKWLIAQVTPGKGRLIRS
jgi:hypothetical protein